MDIIWKYKIEIKNPDVFEKIEKEYGIKIPDELKDFIIEANAATPSKYNFMVGNIEKVLGAILSFNYNEVDTDSVFTALTCIENRNLMPFGIDPFGNYICYCLDNKTVVFWNHETNTVSSTEKNLHEFLEELY